ncbi:MAG: hypothetical protein AMXMBFR59_21960 [Rhodanobacteraceae bacterium]
MTCEKPFAPGLYASGQPSASDLARLAAQGVRSVINLRALQEPVDYDEALEAARLGLRYVSIPVAGPQDVTCETVARFSQELEECICHGGTLVHCASSNRAGALVALHHGLTRGTSRDDAVAMGRAAGLTSLEALVDDLLCKHARPEG